MNALLHDRVNVALLALALTGLALGLGLLAAGRPDLATFAWAAGVLPVLATLVVEIVRSVQGAKLQELIDVSVILNALRALRIVPREAVRTPDKPAIPASGRLPGLQLPPA